MYMPSLLFERTEEEKRNPFKSWARSDQAFFAAGACHILADLFTQLHRGEHFKMVYLEPSEGLPGNHVYATNGIWGFDHNGWTKESELLSTIEQAYSLKYPGWDYSKLTIEPGPDALEKFCKDHNHRLPWQYAYLPWERAYSYINKFDSTPPTDSAV